MSGVPAIWIKTEHVAVLQEATGRLVARVVRGKNGWLAVVDWVDGGMRVRGIFGRKARAGDNRHLPTMLDGMKRVEQFLMDEFKQPPEIMP